MAVTVVAAVTVAVAAMLLSHAELVTKIEFNQHDCPWVHKPHYAHLFVLMAAIEPPTPPPTAAVMTTITSAAESKNVVLRMPSIVRSEACSGFIGGVDGSWEF
jgi:hypothetical protein